MGTRINDTAIAESIEASLLKQISHRSSPPAVASLEPSTTLQAVPMAEACARTGIVFNRISSSSGSILPLIDKMNQDPTVHGILVNGIAPEADPDHWRDLISTHKDVAGAGPMAAGQALTGKGTLHPVAALWPTVAVEDAGLNLWGARAAVLGQGDPVSRALAMILVDKRATTTYWNMNRARDIDLSEADVVFTAAGRRKRVTADQLKPGCLIVELVPGSVDPAAWEIASAYLPAADGISPIAVALLLRNAASLLSE